MRRIILITVFLFLAVIAITVYYFSKITLPGQNTANVISEIPVDAALVFEFKNDPEFFDLFKNSTLLTSFIGQNQANELQFLHDHLLNQNTLKAGLKDRSIFISLHPGNVPQNIDLLLSANISGLKNVQQELSAWIIKNGGFVQTESVANQEVLKISFPALKEAFYLGSKKTILAGSFSKTLLSRFYQEKTETETRHFTQLSDQQNKNSIADLYINYQQFPGLFKQLLRYRNDDFFRFLSDFSANGALSLNYKSDALLFNGYTQVDANKTSYLQIFLKQQPVKNALKDIYPTNTAFAVNFSYAISEQFLKALDVWQTKIHDDQKAKALFNQIKKETGVSIQTAFRKELQQEFSVITTAKSEKMAIIKVKNGSELAPFLRNISLEPDSDRSQFKYQNLPYFLLGEPLLHFKQPYFALIDNYLLLSNSKSAMNNYLENYHHQHFLSDDKSYFSFDQLLAEQSNISFFVHFKNAEPILNNTLQRAFAAAFTGKNSDWKQHYAAALQFTASENSFYTNFYMQEKTTEVAKKDSSSL